MDRTGTRQNFIEKNIYGYCIRYDIIGLASEAPRERDRSVEYISRKAKIKGAISIAILYEIFPNKREYNRLNNRLIILKKR